MNSIKTSTSQIIRRDYDSWGQPDCPSTISRIVDAFIFLTFAYRTAIENRCIAAPTGRYGRVISPGASRNELLDHIYSKCLVYVGITFKIDNQWAITIDNWVTFNVPSGSFDVERYLSVASRNIGYLEYD